MTAKLETYAHIQEVQRLLARVVSSFLDRSNAHDQSKLASPEAEVFEEYTSKLRGCTYGSDEYKGFLAGMKPALDHHYAHNSHHPEHYGWGCPVCNLRITEAQWTFAPQGPNESGDRYCPRCCRMGMLYESQLIHDAQGIRGMSLLDVLEMLCDWKAATMRHADGDLAKSIEINQKRFGYSDELKSILTNTANELGLIH